MHYPGQFIRHIESPAVDVIYKRNDKSRKITLTIPSITTLRKRSTRLALCDESSSDDGDTFRSKVVQDVNCKPGYWIPFIKEDMENPICELPEQLEKVHNHILNASEILSIDPAPCTAMLIPIAVQKDDSKATGMIDISVIYSTAEYQKIVNIPKSLSVFQETS